MNALADKLKKLSLTTAALQLDDVLRDAARRNLSAADTLERLVDLELATRQDRAILRRFHLSRLLTKPDIAQFHFAHHKSRQQARERLLRLLDLDFVRKGTNVIFLGNPGTGKTFLAKTVGWKACQANLRVLFTSAMDMLNHLAAAQVDHSLARKLRTYTDPALLICDELGYLALDPQTSNLFFQVISARYGYKRSTLITTNTPFSEWGNILHNTTIATAVADRLVEDSQVFLLDGDSFRKSGARNRGAGPSTGSGAAL